MRIDEDKRREWLRALQKFKQGVRLRARMGVMETYCKQVADQRRGQAQWDSPLWAHEDWITLLYTSIRDYTFPPGLLIGFVKTSEVTFLSPNMQPTVESALLAMDEVCKRLSVPLRERFNVFITEEESEK